jgi:hypothetical protein
MTNKSTHSNNSISGIQGAYPLLGEKKTSTPQPILGGPVASAFTKKKKSHQLPGTSSQQPGYGSIINTGNNPAPQSGKEPSILMFNNHPAAAASGFS